MRDARLVLVIAAVLEKRLRTPICVMQTDRYTEWRVGDRGFAVGPHLESYPIGKLVQTIATYMTPPKPQKRGHIDE